MVKTSCFFAVGLIALALVAGACEDAEVSTIGIPPPGADVSAPANPAPWDPAAQPDAAPEACPSAIPAVNASNGWSSTPATRPTRRNFFFELMARPGAANLNGLVAIGAQDIDDFTDAPVAVRFADNGIVDLRNGSAYDSDGFFEYEVGTWYNIAISADVGAQSYDVEVGRCGEQRETLIRGVSFRADATVGDELNAWALWSSQNAMLEVSVPTWLASGSCAPASCNSLGHTCGLPADGCNGNLSCAQCGSGETCSRGPPRPGAASCRRTSVGRS